MASFSGYREAICILLFLQKILDRGKEKILNINAILPIIFITRCTTFHIYEPYNIWECYIREHKSVLKYCAHSLILIVPFSHRSAGKSTINSNCRTLKNY